MAHELRKRESVPFTLKPHKPKEKTRDFTGYKTRIENQLLIFTNKRELVCDPCINERKKTE